MSAMSPWLFFGGAYGNLEATQALFAAAIDLKIPSERIVCTGDVTAYSADPMAVIDLIRDREITVIMGNCEESLGLGLDDCGCGFEPGTECESLSQNWYAYNQTQLDGECRSWMAALPRRMNLDLGGFDATVIHGGVSEIAKYMFASTPGETFDREFDAAASDIVIAGHSGLPFTRLWPDRLWHNPGVIGMPANDGAPRTWFSVLTPGPDGIVIDHLALDYDHARTAEKMYANFLPAGYARSLSTGLWPSLDVLPDAEKARTGTPLGRDRHHWASSNHLESAARAP